MYTAGKWSCWVWNKENKVMISLSDIWLWVLSATRVLSEGWSLASNRDCRHLLSSNQRQITTRMSSDLYSLCSSIPKERQVPGHHAPSQQYINSSQDVKRNKYNYNLSTFGLKKRNTSQDMINKFSYLILNLNPPLPLSWGGVYGQRVEAVSGGGNPQWSALICHRYAAEVQRSC